VPPQDLVLGRLLRKGCARFACAQEGAAAPGEIGVIAGESQASISARSPAKVIGLTIPGFVPAAIIDQRVANWRRFYEVHA
jgi:hypothetical protein